MGEKSAKSVIVISTGNEKSHTTVILGVTANGRRLPRYFEDKNVSKGTVSYQLDVYKRQGVE